MDLKERILSFFFPPTCMVCRRVIPPEIFLCPSCRERVELLEGSCPRCSAPLDPSGFGCSWCGDYPFSFRGVRAVARYRGDWRDVIHRFKYRGERHLALPLAALMNCRLQEWGITFDLITPVPLHPRRLRERGYNQSALMAEELSRRAGKPCRALVERSIDTPPQAGLNRWQRLKNLEGAFTVGAPLRGRPRLLVVDDVLTTGATAQAVTAALLKGGAGEVYILAAALNLKI
jgi:competence protein ComFC